MINFKADHGVELSVWEGVSKNWVDCKDSCFLSALPTNKKWPQAKSKKIVKINSSSLFQSSCPAGVDLYFQRLGQMTQDTVKATVFSACGRVHRLQEESIVMNEGFVSCLLDQDTDLQRLCLTVKLKVLSEECPGLLCKQQVGLQSSTCVDVCSSGGRGGEPLVANIEPNGTAQEHKCGDL